MEGTTQAGTGPGRRGERCRRPRWGLSSEQGGWGTVEARAEGRRRSGPWLKMPDSNRTPQGVSLSKVQPLRWTAPKRHTGGRPDSTRQCIGGCGQPRVHPWLLDGAHVPPRTGQCSPLPVGGCSRNGRHQGQSTSRWGVGDEASAGCSDVSGAPTWVAPTGMRSDQGSVATVHRPVAGQGKGGGAGPVRGAQGRWVGQGSQPG